MWEIADGIPSDNADLVALDERNFKRGDRFSRRLWRAILGGRVGRSEMLTLVARHQGAMIGAIVGEFHPAEGRLVIWSIAVDEAHRGTGLAERLMADVLERTPASLTLVTLDARRDNPRARRFYERLGFLQAHEVPHMYADGTDAIAYETSVDQLRSTIDGT